MPDQEPVLLQAVLNAPYDDAPRLAYADWCERQPNEATRARAEFIRAQLRMAQPDFGTLDGVSQYRVSGRAEELLTRYRREWAGRVAELTANYGFRRGFVDWVQISAAGLLAHGGELYALAPVSHADITALRDVDERFFPSDCLQPLHSLLLDNCGLYDLHIQLLADSPSVAEIRWLSLSNNHIGTKGVEALATSKNLAHLRFVELGGNPFDPTEQLGIDGGVIVASVFPQAGRDLEARYGILPWLHRDEIVQRFLQ